jgi:beta-lactamase class A
MIHRRNLIAVSAALAGVSALGARRAHADDGFAGLERAFAGIEAKRGGRLGVAVIDTADGRRAGYRRDERFPMCSTFKCLAAAAVLASVDAGRDKLERVIRFTKKDVKTYSPATEPHADGEGMTLAEICEAAVTLSDNTAGNLMLGAIDGPPGLTSFLRGIGDKVTRLDRFELELNEALPGDPRDTTTPAAMAGSLRTLALGDALSAKGKTQLVLWLRACKTGDKRLKAGLPAGWQVGDKTGTGQRNTSNDVGLLFPPGGRPPIVVAAYLTQGAADGSVRDAALADVGAAVAAAVGG